MNERKNANAWLPAAVLRFCAVLALGLAPWPGFEDMFCAAYRSLANAVALPLAAEPTQFGMVRASVAAESGRVSDAESWDTRLTLEIPYQGQIDHVYLNLRRSSYIPLLAFVALIAAAPGGRGVRLRCLGLGVPLILGYAMTSIWCTSQWLLGAIPGIGGGWSAFHTGFVQMTYRALVVPESNRYIVPLLIAGLTLALFGFGTASAEKSGPRHARQARTEGIAR